MNDQNLSSAVEREVTTAAEQPISEARLLANRANAQFSTGAKSPATKSICAQNHTVHGLARHQNGNFKILASEDAGAFEALTQSLIEEHAALTTTELILVTSMAECHWLAQRAQRLQDTCIDPETGAITDAPKASLYLRYFTTHTRMFHKSLNDLAKLRADRRKAELGFEAQRLKEQAQKRQTERHEMKKQSHAVDLANKEGKIRNQACVNAKMRLEARLQNILFQPTFNEELAKLKAIQEEKKTEAQAA
jgi:hypothetical protein